MEPARLARPTLTWSIVGRDYAGIALATQWPSVVTPDHAWGNATGRGVRVCILDSGVEGDHPMVGEVQSSHAVQDQPAGGWAVIAGKAEDLSGHGTACASVVRSLAPDCEIHSVRVLSNGMSGSADALLAGLRWVIAQRFDIVNLSLSTTRHKFADALRTLADEAYFRKTVLVASAHNLPVESYPWRFSSVISVGSHDTRDPRLFLYNPTPPVEFFAHGVDVEVAWLGGGVRRCTGNSFATPHIAGYCALILSKNPKLTAFQVKNMLYLTAANVRGA
ncbi:MAG: S8 family serine peptidase [Actinomycetota bacterium]|nr:S8 family serine peptidase [Actinomycetota bacterium]